ncbi:MAG: DUF3786 domain-containing protein [bacterium]|nr:DUF3786 domain-containing protein [bacterium]
MNSKPHLPSSAPRNYGDAYELACKRLAAIDDIAAQCRQSGAQYRVKDSRTEITIQYLNRSYLITLPDITVSQVDSAEEVPVRDKLLILHYFISAKGTPAANRLITFRELPEGSVYFPTFSQRTIKPLLNRFGKEPNLLLEAGIKLGGSKVDLGDTALTINAFCRVPISIILWQGDDELAPQGSILFDDTIADYLPTEDITVLCEVITWKLIRS